MRLVAPRRARAAARPASPGARRPRQGGRRDRDDRGSRRSPGQRERARRPGRRPRRGLARTREELDRSGRGGGSQEWPQGRRAGQLATRTGDVAAWIISLMRTTRDGTLERYPSICGAGSIASLSAMQGGCGIQAALFGRHERAVPEHAVQDREGARRSAATTASAKAASAPDPIADRDPREGQLPEREIPPRAPVAFELDRSGGVREHVVRARRTMPARSIARPDSNEAVPSGGRPSNDPRSAMSANVSSQPRRPRRVAPRLPALPAMDGRGGFAIRTAVATLVWSRPARPVEVDASVADRLARRGPGRLPRTRGRRRG